MTLQLDRLTVSYRRRAIFDRLSHTFERGCHLILGANGAGKSTLLGAVAGNVAYRGNILVNGYELTRNSVEARRALAYVPDSTTFYPFMTGAQFTDFVLHTHGLGPISAEPRYAQIVDRLNVREHLSTRFGEASLGTRKKFFLLAALLLETEVLIMDEPFNGIDHATTLALIELLNQIAPNNTILLTCHLPQIIEAIHGVRWHLGRSPHTRITRDVSGHAFA